MPSSRRRDKTRPRRFGVILLISARALTHTKTPPTRVAREDYGAQINAFNTYAHARCILHSPFIGKPHARNIWPDRRRRRLYLYEMLNIYRIRFCLCAFALSVCVFLSEKKTHTSTHILYAIPPYVYKLVYRFIESRQYRTSKLRAT